MRTADNAFRNGPWGDLVRDTEKQIRPLKFSFQRLQWENLGKIKIMLTMFSRKGQLCRTAHSYFSKVWDRRNPFWMDVIPRATYYNQGTWTHFVCSGCMPQLCLLCKVSYFPEFISKFNSLNIIKACLPALLSGNNYLGYPQNIGVEGSKIIQILILQRRGRPGLFEVGFCTALGWSLRMLGEGCPAVF